MWNLVYMTTIGRNQRDTLASFIPFSLYEAGLGSTPWGHDTSRGISLIEACLISYLMILQSRAFDTGMLLIQVLFVHLSAPLWVLLIWLSSWKDFKALQWLLSSSQIPDWNMSKAFCLLPHQGNYSSRRSVSRWWFLCPHILSWRTWSADWHTAFKWPAQSYFQHQGLEYTSVEAFENLMRATVIAFMARSASDLCVIYLFFLWVGQGHAHYCVFGMFMLGAQSIKDVGSGNGVWCRLVFFVWCVYACARYGTSCWA